MVLLIALFVTIVRLFCWSLVDTIALFVWIDRSYRSFVSLILLFDRLLWPWSALIDVRLHDFFKIMLELTVIWLYLAISGYWSIQSLAPLHLRRMLYKLDYFKEVKRSLHLLLVVFWYWWLLWLLIGIRICLIHGSPTPPKIVKSVPWHTSSLTKSWWRY